MRESPRCVETTGEGRREASERVVEMKKAARRNVPKGAEERDAKRRVMMMMIEKTVPSRAPSLIQSVNDSGVEEKCMARHFIKRDRPLPPPELQKLISGNGERETGET